jgi:hypothetical protein
MWAHRMKLSLSIVTMLAVVSACGPNPQFKINSANQVFSAGNELHTLLAKADLNAFQSSSTFAAHLDSYASVIGGFEIGRQVAVVRPVSATPKKAAALDALDSNITECIARLKQMAELHHTSGIDAGSDITQSVRNTCNKALRSVAANETSAWLVTTAADDL